MIVSFSWAGEVGRTVEREFPSVPRVGEFVGVVADDSRPYGVRLDEVTKVAYFAPNERPFGIAIELKIVDRPYGRAQW